MTKVGTALFLSALFAALLAYGCDRRVKWTTSTGLKIIEVQEGEGTLGRKGDVVSIVYTAWYVDGDQFDSFQDREHPYQFRLGFGGVMPGLQEGIATMRQGGKRILILPPELAFGKEGRGMVPPDTWVKFEVELLVIDPGPIPPTPWNDAGRDIVVTDSGLQYVDFRIGEGASPTPKDEIVVHYSAFLDDGTVFDSSYYSGSPIRFSLEGGTLIDGWKEGIITMRAGGRRKLIIPPHLGYGEVGYRNTVPPNATLIYDIELLVVGY
jgi:peptidylprolyl isomerase